MTPTRVLGIVFATILMAPGLCFFGFGASFMSSGNNQNIGLSALLVAIGVAILAGAVLIFRIAARAAPSDPPLGLGLKRRPQPPPEEPPPQA